MNRNLLKIVFLLLFFESGCMASAQTQRLVVWMKNGEKVYFDLCEQPKTTFEDQYLTITATQISVSYPLSQIVRYTYELPTTGIETTNDNITQITMRGDELTFQHLKPGSTIRVYAMDGMLIHAEKAGPDAVTIVSLAKFTSGVYIVKVGDKTHKIMIR